MKRWNMTYGNLRSMITFLFSYLIFLFLSFYHILTLFSFIILVLLHYIFLKQSWVSKGSLKFYGGGKRPWSESQRDHVLRLEFVVAREGRSSVLSSFICWNSINKIERHCESFSHINFPRFLMSKKPKAINYRLY